MSTLLALLDAFDALPAAAALRQRSYDLLAPLDGLVVDVGCGGGRAVAELTELTTTVGVDLDPEMVEVASTRWPGSTFLLGDATDLPLEDGSATGYRADKVVHTLHEPARALVEARRVLTPGGRAVLLGQDWDTLVIDSDDPVLTRTIRHARADLVAAPRAARQYRNLLLDHGFTDVAVEVHTSVHTGPMILPMLAELAASVGERADGWLREQAERAENDRLFVAIPIFVAAGIRVG